MIQLEDNFYINKAQIVSIRWTGMWYEILMQNGEKYCVRPRSEYIKNVYNFMSEE